MHLERYLVQWLPEVTDFLNEGLCFIVAFKGKVAEHGERQIQGLCHAFEYAGLS